MQRSRRSIRLSGYDYRSGGAYFITLVTHERECLFGEVIDSTCHLTRLGEMVEREWLRTAEVRELVTLDTYVIMPNHLHGIVVIERRDELPGDARHFGASQAGSLGSIVGQFKSRVTKAARQLANEPDMRVWQRNYWERVIRDDAELQRIRQYIIDNPANWDDDAENPAKNASARTTT